MCRDELWLPSNSYEQETSEYCFLQSELSKVKFLLAAFWLYTLWFYGDKSGGSDDTLVETKYHMPSRDGNILCGEELKKFYYLG